MHFSSPAFQLVVAALLVNSVLAKEAQEGMNEFNVACPAERLSMEIDRAHHDCVSGFGAGACARFVRLFKELLPEYDCQRPVDATPTKKYVVPAIWLLGDDVQEDYVRLLSRLRSPDAVALFASKPFRSTLDGALAETYFPLSLSAERKLRRRKQ